MLNDDRPRAAHIGAEPDVHIGTDLDDVTGQIGERVQCGAVMLDADFVHAVREVLDPIRAVPPAEGESVRTRAAGQRVVSKAAREIVVAVVSEQRIAAGAASNEIVPSSAMREDEVLGPPSGQIVRFLN